jgi:RNA polymerase sigma-70 factor (ECF subfamily)
VTDPVTDPVTDIVTEVATPDIRAQLDAVYRAESRRVRATLVRLLRDLDAAEEAVHDAFAQAAERWPQEGLPQNPYAWLVSVGRFRTLDRWRRHRRLAAAAPTLEVLAEAMAVPDLSEQLDHAHLDDDTLRLIFVCCHPALAPEARVALTLREVCGLTTEEIARAFLAPTPTIAQRIVRAKAKLRDEAIAYEIPSRTELAPRLDSVLQVIYLIFNEGYAATDGPALTRPDLGATALRLGRLVVALSSDVEAIGLLALMLLHQSRQATRVDTAGEIVLLEDQDRSRWDRASIEEAQALLERATASRRIGPHVLQAAIAAVHARAPTLAATDWSQIIALYDVLFRVAPSPVVALNRAVAFAARDGAEAGLAAIDTVIGQGGLDDYHLAHAARADMLRRLGRTAAARVAYTRALSLVKQGTERRFLEARLAALL